MDPEPWHPTYTIAADGSRTIALEDVAPNECPSSIIHRFPAVDALAREVGESLRLQEMTGAFPFGSDMTRWPARWYDGVQLAQMEISRLDRAVDRRRQLG